jgi:hypothetical protein
MNWVPTADVIAIEIVSDASFFIVVLTLHNIYTYIIYTTYYLNIGFMFERLRHNFARYVFTVSSHFHDVHGSVLHSNFFVLKSVVCQF